MCIQIYNQMDSSLGLAVNGLVSEVIFLHVRLFILSL